MIENHKHENSLLQQQIIELKKEKSIMQQQIVHFSTKIAALEDNVGL